MLEEHLPLFTDALRAQRYCAGTAAISLRVARHFLDYVTRRAFTPADIEVGYARGYLARRLRQFEALHGHPMHPVYFGILRAALHRFVRYLAATGACPALHFSRQRDLRAVPGHEALLTEYEQYLVLQRGLAQATVLEYLDQASRLCRARGPAAGPDWDTLSPGLLYDHLLTCAGHRTHHSLRCALTALRSFFRFLRVTGRSAKPLERYFVRYRGHPRSRLPTTLSTEDLHRLFETVRGDSPKEVAYRAVLLLLTLNGLRSGEVARLRLDDVHWRAQTIVFRRRKCGRDLLLPLHPAVASALARYIQEVRPRGTPDREVFLTRLAPPRPYLRGATLARPITEHLRKHGLRVRLHSLRHSLASRLLNHDCPPEWIQLLLGHIDFDSTRVYARVDLAHLREVAADDLPAARPAGRKKDATGIAQPF